MRKHLIKIYFNKFKIQQNKSTINLKSKEKKLNNKCVINKIKIINKEKNMSISSENSKNNTQRKSPILNINKFDLISKKCKTQKKLSKRIIDKSLKKEKKEKIEEKIAKTSINSCRNSNNDINESIKTKKETSLIYKRKRNINERYKKLYNNNSSINSSKDSARIYYSIQSIEKEKEKEKNKIIEPKLKQNNKNNIYYKCNKKFVAIQNFSRYQKKSVLFYKNNEKEIKERKRKNEQKKELKKFLDMQVEEKKKEQDFLKELEHEQARIWNVDIQKYNEDEKIIDNKIKKMNRRNFEYILKQMKENSTKKLIKHNTDMTNDEYDMNKELLKKAKNSFLIDEEKNK